MKIARFSQNSKTTDIMQAVERDGVAIVEKLIDDTACTAIIHEVEPILDAIPYGWEPFIGYRTKRFGALASRVPASHVLITNPAIIDAVEHYLLPNTEKIYLNSTQFIVPYHGQKDQVLHRDRDSWPYLPDFIEPQLNIIWAISEFTEQNGATRFALGSHKWEQERKPKPEEIARATMPAGSAMIFNGGVIHGGGANKTVVPRIGLAFSYCLAWLRPEENQFLSCPPDIAKGLDPKLQDLLGYTTISGALGYYSDPYADIVDAGIRPPEYAVGREVVQETD